MYFKAGNRDMAKLVIIAAVSVAAGFVNGLLGAGGGILFVFILSRMRKDMGIDSDDNARDDFATTIAAILPISVVSVFMYGVKGSFSFDEIPVYIIPAIAGGVSGAFLLDRIKIPWLKKIFAALVIYSGVSMLLK